MIRYAAIIPTILIFAGLAQAQGLRQSAEQCQDDLRVWSADDNAGAANHWEFNDLDSRAAELDFCADVYQSRIPLLDRAGYAALKNTLLVLAGKRLVDYIDRHAENEQYVAFETKAVLNPNHTPRRTLAPDQCQTESKLKLPQRTQLNYAESTARAKEMEYCAAAIPIQSERDSKAINNSIRYAARAAFYLDYVKDLLKSYIQSTEEWNTFLTEDANGMR